MEDLGLQDTFAYRIIKQIMDHTWSDESKLSDTEVIYVYHRFSNGGGSWQKLMDGSIEEIKTLEDAIKDLLNVRAIKTTLNG